MTLPVHHVIELGTTVVLRSTGSKHATAGHCQKNRSVITCYSCCSQTCSSCIETYHIRRAFDVHVTGQRSCYGSIHKCRSWRVRSSNRFVYITSEHGHVTALKHHALVWTLQRHSMLSSNINSWYS